MQMFVFSILLVTSAQCFLSKVTSITKRLPSPFSTKVIAFDPAGMIIKWSPVSSDLEPVIGYKVKLWEAQPKKIYVLKNVNGYEEFVEELRMPESSIFSPKDGKLFEYMLTGAEHSQLTFHGIKLDTPYMYEVVAFGPSGDGEPTGHVGLQFSNSQNSTRSDT